MDGWIKGWMKGWMNEWIKGWVDYGYVDKGMGRWMDGWMTDNIVQHFILPDLVSTFTSSRVCKEMAKEDLFKV